MSPSQALCMFDDMKERRLRCDELVYNTLMEGMCKLCKLVQAPGKG